MRQSDPVLLLAISKQQQIQSGCFLIENKPRIFFTSDILNHCLSLREHVGAVGRQKQSLSPSPTSSNPPHTLMKRLAHTIITESFKRYRERNVSKDTHLDGIQVHKLFPRKSHWPRFVYKLECCSALHEACSDIQTCVKWWKCSDVVR